MNLLLLIAFLLTGLLQTIAIAKDSEAQFQPWGQVKYSTHCGDRAEGKFTDRFSEDLKELGPWLSYCATNISNSAKEKLEKLTDAGEISCVVRLTRDGRIQPETITKSSGHSELDQEFTNILRSAPALKYAPPNMLPFNSQIQSICKSGKLSLIIVRK